MQSAAEESERFPDGLWWVELAPLQVAVDVSTVVAASVGAPLSEAEPHADAITSRIGDSRALIVLDNCEHVIERGQTRLRVRQGARTYKSWRRADHHWGSWRGYLAGVTTFHAGPWQLEANYNRAAEPIRFGSALHRPRTKARPAFTLTNANGPAVAEIFHRLNGIPLAIELATARCKSLLPNQILDGLDDALHLSSGGRARPSPPTNLEHPSVGALHFSACQNKPSSSGSPCSLAHLIFGEQKQFAAVTVFTKSTWENTLEKLIDQSLVVPWDETGDGRFLMLETVRQYGAGELEWDAWIEQWARSAFNILHTLQRKKWPLL